MNSDKKAAQVASTGTAQKQNTDLHSATTDPLLGWHALAKPSRDRQQKKAWMMRKKGGAR
jgi:hypothetical protein